MASSISGRQPDEDNVQRKEVARKRDQPWLISLQAGMQPPGRYSISNHYGLRPEREGLHLVLQLRAEVGISEAEDLGNVAAATSEAGASNQNPSNASGAGATDQNPSSASGSGTSDKNPARTSGTEKREAASGFCGWGQRRRKKFLEKVYCDRRYSDQQIALIQEADRAGIPLSGLKELCDPKISLGNMQVMLSYMKR